MAPEPAYTEEQARAFRTIAPDLFDSCLKRPMTQCCALYRKEHSTSNGTGHNNKGPTQGRGAAKGLNSRGRAGAKGRLF